MPIIGGMKMRGRVAGPVWEAMTMVVRCRMTAWKNSCCSLRKHQTHGVRVKGAHRQRANASKDMRHGA